MTSPFSDEFLTQEYLRLGGALPTLTKKGEGDKRVCISESIPLGIDDKDMLVYIAKAFTEAGAEVTAHQGQILRILFRKDQRLIGLMSVMKLRPPDAWILNFKWIDGGDVQKDTCSNLVVGHHLINLMFDKFREAYHSRAQK